MFFYVKLARTPSHPQKLRFEKYCGIVIRSLRVTTTKTTTKTLRSVFSWRTSILLILPRLRAEGVPVHMLDTQYRMHSTICAYPSQAFYDDKLQTGVSDDARQPPRGLPSNGKPLVFIDVKVLLNTVFSSMALCIIHKLRSDVMLKFTQRDLLS